MQNSIKMKLIYKITIKTYRKHRDVKHQSIEEW